MAYPDAVALVRSYLAGLHTGMTVASRVPSPEPSAWIQVRQVGGAAQVPVRDSARLDIFYWAADEPAAFAGGELVRREINALKGTSTLGPVCYEVSEVMAPRQFDDPLTGKPARWATYSLLLRADDVTPY